MNTNTFNALRQAAQDMLIKSSPDRGVTIRPQSLGAALAIASNSLYCPRKGNAQVRIAVKGGWEFRLSTKGWVDHNNRLVGDLTANALNWAMTFHENLERNNAAYVVCVTDWHAVAVGFESMFGFLLDTIQ